MSSRGVGDAIQKGIAFMASAQSADGGFDTLSSPDALSFSPAITYRTTFAPALILSALHGIDDTVYSVQQKLASWLVAQKSPLGSLNYWAVDAPQRLTMPYPDDLDATFCALIALHLYQPSIVNEEWLAATVKLLLATETKVGGPYRTWLVPATAAKAWQDVDMAVNSNIACFLGLVSSPLPNLTALLEKAITSHSFRSPYYPDEYSIIYYIARAYKGDLRNQLARYLLSKCQREGWWGSPLASALALSSLVRLGHKTKYGALGRKLLASQQPDGSWPAEAFSIDPSIGKKKHFSGSAALTTAFVLEALNLSQATDSPKKTPQPQAATLPQHTQVLKAALQEIRTLAPELRIHSLTFVKHIQKRDKGQDITLLPYLFNASLLKPLPDVSQAPLRHLGLANLYGWMAYTIYDDFLDNEGKPELLSTANAALRYSIKHFSQAVPQNEFQELTERTFNTIDGANAWELAHCRASVTDGRITLGPLPRFSDTLQLADRSLGHSLTPLGVLAALGVMPGDRPAVSVQRAFRHYLVARQLNDDLHDWEQDFQKGIITYVVAAIAQELAMPPGTYPITKLLPDMQHQFWHHTLATIYKTVTRHTALARRAVQSSGLLKEVNFMTDLLDAVDSSAQHALTEQAKTKHFLSAYKTERTPKQTDLFGRHVLDGHQKAG